MATEQQIQANRLNAQKSTGPKTPEGKAKSSQNAVTHGLTSMRPVLDIEDTAEFHQFTSQWLGQLAPSNPLELYFAQRTASQAWRIQRAQCYETLILNHLIKNASETFKTNPNDYSGVIPNECEGSIDSSHPDDSRDSADALLGQILTDDFRTHHTLEKITRYEMRLETSMIRCLDQFKKLRQSEMMNFNSLSHSFRGPNANEPNKANVGADPCVCPQNDGKSAVTDSHPERSEGSLDAFAQNEPILTPKESSLSEAKDLFLSKQTQSTPDMLMQIETKKLRERRMFKKAV